MQKYDVEQLLKQQKDSVYQSIATILVAFSVSITASIFLVHYSKFASSNNAFYIVIFLVVFLLLIPVIKFLIYRNDYVTAKKEKMTLLFTFEKTNDSLKLTKFNDYPFSIFTADYWNNFLQINDNSNKVTTSHRKSSRMYSDVSFFDKATYDLIFYSILRTISTNDSRSFFKKDYLDWIIYQDESIKNNLFVKSIHSKQIEYEELSRDGMKIKGAYSYLPFSLNFPYDIEFELEKSDNLSIPKIILKNDIIRVTINFKEETCFDKSFVYTSMKPGNRNKFYDERCFMMSTEFDINKYAFFKAKESEVDNFWNWANDLIVNLKKFCDWEHYEEKFQRSQIQDLSNKLDAMKREINLEHYFNFEDNPHGRVKKLLRYTIHPDFFEYRRDAIDQIVDIKNEIPEDLIEDVIHRMLLLINYNEGVTSFKAAEALGNLRDIIPINLHQDVVNALIEIVDNDDLKNEEKAITKKYSVRSLVLLYPFILPSLKKKIHDTIIKNYVSNTQTSSDSCELSQAIISIYDLIPTNYKEQYEEMYYNKNLSSSQDLEVIHGLKFFAVVSPFIEIDKRREIIIKLLKINPNHLDLLVEYLNALASLWYKIPNEFIEEIFAKIYPLLVSDNREYRIKVIKRFLINPSFIDNLGIDKKSKIFEKLVEYSTSEHGDLKWVSLDSLTIIIKFLPGNEDKIANLLLDEIGMTDKIGLDRIKYHVNDCLKTISSNVQPETLAKINKYIQQDNLH
jgi:hypothetical protein